MNTSKANINLRAHTFSSTFRFLLVLIESILPVLIVLLLLELTFESQSCVEYVECLLRLLLLLIGIKSCNPDVSLENDRAALSSNSPIDGRTDDLVDDSKSLSSSLTLFCVLFQISAAIVINEKMFTRVDCKLKLPYLG